MHPASQFTIKLQLLLLIGLGGCATQQGNAASYRSDVLSAEEIMETSANDAFDAVRLLRSRWLRARAAPSIASPGSEYAKIYVDNIPRSGGLDDLRSIPVGDIREIRYMNPSNATTRFGTGHAGGVIMVITR